MPLSLPCSICGKREPAKLAGVSGSKQLAIWDGMRSHLACLDTPCVDRARKNANRAINKKTKHEQKHSKKVAPTTKG